MHIFDLFRTRQTDRLKASAVALDCYAAEVMRLALSLDDSGEACSCCSAVRYRNWPQKQLRDRMEGAAQRLQEIAETMRRRAHDPEFLGDPKPDQDLLTRALTEVDEKAQGSVIPPAVLALVRRIVRGSSSAPAEAP